MAIGKRINATTGEVTEFEFEQEIAPAPKDTRDPVAMAICEALKLDFDAISRRADEIVRSRR